MRNTLALVIIIVTLYCLYILSNRSEGFEDESTHDRGRLEDSRKKYYWQKKIETRENFEDESTYSRGRLEDSREKYFWHTKMEDKRRKSKEGFSNATKTKKIAFLFLVRDNHHQIEVWNSFFRGISKSKYNIYVHAKFPGKVIQPLMKNHLLPNSLQTKWGDVSIVRATMLLLRKAFEDLDNYKFVLLSESCIPLYNFEHIYTKLTEDNNTYLGVFNFDAILKENRYKGIDSKFLAKNNFKKMHQWFVMNRETVKYFITYDYTDQYKNVSCPDEHYFVNIMDKFSLPYDNRLNTFVNWNEPTPDPSKRPFPKTYMYILPSDIIKGRHSGALFFRKVCKGTEIKAKIFD